MMQPENDTGSLKTKIRISFHQKPNADFLHTLFMRQRAG